jgi:hypothetical protein
MQRVVYSISTNQYSLKIIKWKVVERKTWKQVYCKQAKIHITSNESNSKRDDRMPSATGKTQNIR